MGTPIRAIVFNADEAYAVELRQALNAVSDVRIVAEIDEPSLLPQAVAQFPCDVVIANLDPLALVVLEVSSQIQTAQQRLPVVAISSSTDGEILLRAMRAGLKGFLLKPLKPDELRPIFEQIAAERTIEREPGKLISVVGCAGGVGATFLATNLAVELADLAGANKKVALLDFDFRFGQVATILDLAPQFTVADLCATPEQVDPNMIDKALVKHDSGVYVLGRPHTFQQAECITAAHCVNVISVLQEMCAYVVIDGPMRSDPGGRMILDVADYNFMVLQLLVTGVRNADRMMQELAGQGFNPGRIQFICNRVGRDSAHLEAEQVEKTLNAKLFHTLPDDWRTVSAAINVGKPLSAESNRSKIRQSVRELATRIHAPQSAQVSTKSAGMLGRLLKGMQRAPAAASASPAVAPA